MNEPNIEYSAQYYYCVGYSIVGRWQIRRSTIEEPDNWTLIEDLGPPSAVLSACIEADGDFDYKAGDESITLTTTDTPWVAVITTTKKLYVKQVCADITTAILLDTGVEQASLCRGWKSDKYSVDSGLICAYRKANGVYAKVYKKVNGEYVWETLPQLLYEPVDHVEVKRLNDYRIGVYVTNPNRLLLSERFYIGGTSKTEYINLKSSSWINVATAHPVSEPAYQDFKFTDITLENGDTDIRLHGNYKIYSIDFQYKNNISLVDSVRVSSIVSYEISNGDIIIHMDNPKATVWNTLTITIGPAGRIVYEIPGQRRGVVPDMTFTVPNSNFVPYEYVVLTATSVVGELVVKQREDFNAKSTEHIYLSGTATVGIVSADTVHYKTGTCPDEIVALRGTSAPSELPVTQSGVTPV